MNLSFAVPGNPVPKGSMKFVGRSKRGKPLMTHDNPALRGYMERVKIAANIEVAGRKPMTGPVYVSLVFCMDVKDITAKLDIDKLVRGVLDAMTGIIYVDDGQVVEFSPPFCKMLSDNPRTIIRVGKTDAGREW